MRKEPRNGARGAEIINEVEGGGAHAPVPHRWASTNGSILGGTPGCQWNNNTLGDICTYS